MGSDVCMKDLRENCNDMEVWGDLGNQIQDISKDYYLLCSLSTRASYEEW